ncbi:MAG TPA: hypothetical protein VFS05_16360 [Gemmatimonadaceae bacterium]|nr:hypothetical protein [Gemmatimonadaceae bacterium]
MNRSFLLALACVAAACGQSADKTPPTAATAVPSHASSRAGGAAVKEDTLSPDVRRQLAALRAATGRFHRYDAALEAGYDFRFMDMCMVDESPERLGGMGYHQVDTLLLDGKVDVATPEALMYEPQPNGQLRLVGVEYVIPAAAWTGPGKPTLFGREFRENQFGLWALHVWIWEDNPSGMFKDWNPRVTCDFAR